MTGIIILAAGASTRLGQAKQQLLFRGQTLLQLSVQAAMGSGGAPILLVLGANTETIALQGLPPEVQVVHNPQWVEGMASSIRVGVEELVKVSPKATGALFMLCDQPFVTSSVLNQLIQEKEKTKKGIVACSYQDTLGAPVLFDKSFFPYLLLLQGQEGAKKLLAHFPSDTASVPFPKGAIDIDTPADYVALQNLEQPS
ncbi:nucleotidyltransferase family protein [Rufibacter tibetensis]|uniref:MobA-like NTP transferase domain-containing protein n=1 Tax=Rufibacter tibetensis TaxID=512763 RepID=A0A0P0CLK0_9BACT|nr:nucleotidyltransferase family protein [Rufibacter tibetensis]ALJ00528.1 hypothetical protein DC20_18080 [Rufibacter tibetensis]